MLLLLLLAPPTLAYSADGGRFEARDAGPGGVLTVKVGDAAPLLGTAGRDGATAWFKPRFPVAPGVPHALTFRAADGTVTRAVVTLPRPEATRTSLARVTPSADVLPENLLKFYLHFDGPMRRGESATRVKLLDADGVPVELPFLELDEELWDKAGTRLTLLIDPGRIKRGLKPREDDGPVLEAGKRYTLVIDAGWPDAAGRPLVKPVRKAFTVAAPLAERIDPAAWKLVAPTGAGPLAVRFPEAPGRRLVGTRAHGRRRGREAGGGHRQRVERRDGLDVHADGRVDVGQVHAADRAGAGRPRRQPHRPGVRRRPRRPERRAGGGI